MRRGRRSKGSSLRQRRRVNPSVWWTIGIVFMAIVVSAVFSGGDFSRSISQSASSVLSGNEEAAMLVKVESLYEAYYRVRPNDTEETRRARLEEALGNEEAAALIDVPRSPIDLRVPKGLQNEVRVDALREQTTTTLNEDSLAVIVDIAMPVKITIYAGKKPGSLLFGEAVSSWEKEAGEWKLLAISPLQETPTPPGDESSENVGEDYTKREQQAITVAERVAVTYAGFPPEATGDSRPLVEATIKKLRRDVAPDLRDRIREEWLQGRNWSLQGYRAEVRPGSLLDKRKNGDMEVVVTVDRTLVDPDSPSDDSVVTVLRMRLRNFGGRWKVISLDR